MGPIQNLYYALGEVTHAISKAGGITHKKAKKKLNKVLVEEFNQETLNFDPSDIISHVLEKDSMDATTAYNWAIKEIRLNKHFMTEKIKEHFIHVLQRTIKIFPPSTSKEVFLLDNFINEILAIKEEDVVSKV